LEFPKKYRLGCHALAWPTASPRSATGLGPFHAAAKSLLADHTVAAANLLLAWILPQQKFPPAPLVIGGAAAQLVVAGIFRQQRVRLTRCIRAAARPAIVPGLKHQPGLDRIALDVATATQFRDF
jgi:hypothetical protein